VQVLAQAGADLDVVRKPGRECLTGKGVVESLDDPEAVGSSWCQSFMNSSLICFCSGVIGGRTFGHLAVCIGFSWPAEALGAVDDEPGSGPHLLVDPADVFAEDPDADQLDAAEEEDEDDERRIAHGEGKAAELHHEVGERDQKEAPAIRKPSWVLSVRA
jgi:hypothetical protein